MAINKDQKLSEEFLTKLIQIAGGYLPSETFDKLITLLQSEISNHYFSRPGESNLLRIISAAHDKYSFLNECVKYPHYVEIIISISVNSNYLTDILVRNPEYFYWIINPSNLEPKLDRRDFAKTIDLALNYYKNFASKVNYFRTLKRKEILRIGIKDILNQADLAETTNELSAFANVAASKLFEICYEEIKSKYNISEIKSNYCLIGLGKLGGNELNYSSDIDLIIFYDENSKVNSRSYQEFLTEVIYLFIDSASSITSTGFIFRVDFRLRPDGRNSPLCRSITEYLNYYESRGEDWERQMLIKAGFVGGSVELYNQFKQYLSAFIFPTSFSISPTEQIKKIKNSIEKNLGADENIKLLPGGIRDIEFSVQALQLLNGGRLKELQNGNTLNSIQLLKKHELLSASEEQTLTESYKFYRKIEHYLQLMNDKQTHTIPTDEEMLLKISAYLNFRSSKEFKKAIKSTRDKVLKIYKSIIGSEVKIEKKEDISEISFEHKKKAFQDFTFLREGKGLLGHKEFDERTVSMFQKIEFSVINYLKKAINPDLTLQNLVRIIRHSTIPSIWYKELADEKFLISLLDVCQFAQKSIDMFAEDDELTEKYLNRKVFENIDIASFENYSLKSVMFILSVQFVLGIIDHQKVSNALSNYYRHKIQNKCEEFIDNKNQKIKYFTAALGSFGTNETTFKSDVDLIFVVDDLKKWRNANKLFQNVLIEIRKSLPSIEVDCRLRPEGKSSNLVWDIIGYNNYIQKRMRVWELQAFTKISFLCGDQVMYKSFLNSLNSKAKIEDDENIRKEMNEMRKKLYPAELGGKLSRFNLKKSPGGLTDIEFITQFLVLNSRKIFTDSSSNVINILYDLPDSDKLINNYNFIKQLDLLNQLMFNTTTSILSNEKLKLKMLAGKMGFHDSAKFQSALNEVIKSNKTHFQKYFGTK